MGARAAEMMKSPKCVPEHPDEGKCGEVAIGPGGRDLTLGEILADPITRAVMAADGVDAEELGALLAGIAQANRPARVSRCRSTIS